MTRIQRRYFQPLRDLIPPPELTRLQKDSYEWFLRTGLRELFDEVSPIVDYTGRDLELTFGDYFFDEPKFTEEQAKTKNVSFEAALRVRTRLTNKRTGEIKEQEVYMGDFPVMTTRGTFIINGIERVIVSQLVRAAGMFTTLDIVRGKRLYGAKVIPNRGAWLEFETDAAGCIWVRIDRKRKVAATSLLRAFGLASDGDIEDRFADLLATSPLNFVAATIKRDVAKSQPEGYIEVYRRVRPGDLATVDNARSLIDAMFFNFDRYDLSRVGRYRFNQIFNENLPIAKETRTLRPEDVVNTMRRIIQSATVEAEPDDIDHLSHRRVRAVGELIQNRVRIGLARMERIVVDRMSTMELATLAPAQLINNRPVVGVVKEFFMSSQLSQFMDQTNPLSELEHKRRLSAMGPGGLSRERAGFEVRDVHRTHYSRICPIATPEGANIGLVGHLSSYARINDYGFIEAPYARVEKIEGQGVRLTSKIDWLDAFEEEQEVTTAATTPRDELGQITSDRVEVRRQGKPEVAEAQEVTAMDVSPAQIVSVATALIPFLEHDDATRALMGSNMQRQAVNLVRPEAPIVGTGMEQIAARDSGYVVVAEGPGQVTSVAGNRVSVKYDDGRLVDYPLRKFLRSNASTCINQWPVVDADQRVEAGDLLAEGSGMERGDLALGRNILVAFMPFEGGNYEDAILLSDRLVAHDQLTSIYIEDFKIDVRETKLGPEVVTRDIPNVSEEKLAHLDEEGIIRIGAEVKSSDILVGKITPKGETELSPEEKLLRAIFGEKAKEVRDSSLYLEHGEHGKVVGVKIFAREAGDKLPAGVMQSIIVTIANLRKIQVGDKLAGRHGNKGVISRVIPRENMPHLADGTPVDIVLNPLGVASRMNLGQILETHLGLAARTLGYHAASPPFEGVLEEKIKQELVAAGFPQSGQVTLFDGRTGEKFERSITVGYMYIMKLNHMVEDKIHQRSIGPYSLVTQQPLGGKAQFGGQRFGEMEVWALEAYGASHMLQEMITIKSDDVAGRSRAYEAIIKGEPIQKVNVPESFNVLIRELKGLGLNVELLDPEDRPIPLHDKPHRFVTGQPRLERHTPRP